MAIAAHLGCDWIEYQDCDDLEEAVRSSTRPDMPLPDFDTSCFTGKYVTGEEIGNEYFQRLFADRNSSATEILKSNIESAAADEAKNECESVHNDTSVQGDGKKGCEAI